MSDKFDAVNAGAMFLIDFEARYDQDIEELIAEYKLDCVPSPLDKAKLMAGAKAACESEPELTDLIVKLCPKLMTDYWREEVKEQARIRRQFQRDFDRENFLGKHAPEIKLVASSLPTREPGEVDATNAHLKILEQLGLRDRDLLRTLGHSQAKKLIYAVLELRASANLPWDHVPGFSSVMRQRRAALVAKTKAPSDASQ